MTANLSRFAKFIADRRWYITAFLLYTLLALLIIWLDQKQLRAGNILYLFILGGFFLLIVLLIDYLRQASYLRQLDELRQSAGPDAILGLQGQVTWEQEMMREVLLRQHHAYEEKQSIYRQLEERRHIFINQWVHQMKTPVSVIDLIIQQAEQLDSQQDGQAIITSISEENERLVHGLEMILYQARLDKFEVDAQFNKVNLNELLRFVINEHKNAFIRNSIYPRISGDEVIVETDEKWLGFVCNQLLSNAIKYSRIKPGEKQIHIIISHKAGISRVQMIDEGIGIAETDLPRIFEPYFTGDNGRLTGESTGMGLYLAREVCRKLGHRLDLTSVQGQGTTATLSFKPDGIHHISQIR